MNNIIINLNKVWGESSFFNLLKEGLAFPDYFGNNWDSADECIRDLCWLDSDTAICFRNAEKLRGCNISLYNKIMLFIKRGQDYWNMETANKTIRIIVE